MSRCAAPPHRGGNQSRILFQLDVGCCRHATYILYTRYLATHIRNSEIPTSHKRADDLGACVGAGLWNHTNKSKTRPSSYRPRVRTTVAQGQSSRAKHINNKRAPAVIYTRFEHISGSSNVRANNHRLLLSLTSSFTSTAHVTSHTRYVRIHMC